VPQVPRLLEHVNEYQCMPVAMDMAQEHVFQPANGDSPGWACTHHRCARCRYQDTKAGVWKGTLLIVTPKLSKLPTLTLKNGASLYLHACTGTLPGLPGPLSCTGGAHYGAQVFCLADTSLNGKRLLPWYQRKLLGKVTHPKRGSQAATGANLSATSNTVASHCHVGRSIRLLRRQEHPCSAPSVAIPC
jgi:hypothetical protein